MFEAPNTPAGSDINHGLVWKIKIEHHIFIKIHFIWKQMIWIGIDRQFKLELCYDLVNTNTAQNTVSITMRLKKMTVAARSYIFQT